jgi:hypothetical protein
MWLADNTMSDIVVHDLEIGEAALLPPRKS